MPGSRSAARGWSRRRHGDRWWRAAGRTSCWAYDGRRCADATVCRRQHRYGRDRPRRLLVCRPGRPALDGAPDAARLVAAARRRASPPGVIRRRRGRPPRAHRARAHRASASAGCPTPSSSRSPPPSSSSSPGSPSASRPRDLVDAWGDGFPDLLAFTMQMALVIVTGYVVATARPVRRAIAALARMPASAARRRRHRRRLRDGVLVAQLGLQPGLLARCSRAVASPRRACRARRLPRARAPRRSSASAASGRKGSPARPRCRWRRRRRCRRAIRAIVAGDGAIPGGIITFSHTIFLWQCFVSVAIEIVVVTARRVARRAVERAARDAASLGISLDDARRRRRRRREPQRAATPGERLEHSPLLTLAIVALGAAYLARYLRRRRSTSLTVNTHQPRAAARRHAPALDARAPDARRARGRRPRPGA